MECWLTSSVEARESALISRQYGVPEHSSSSCAEIRVVLDLKRGSQGNT